MYTYNTKNVLIKKRKSHTPLIIIIALLLVAATLVVFLISQGSSSFVVDPNAAPSRALSFDKTSVTSKTYTLVGIGLCKDKDVVVPAEKDGMPVVSVGEMAFRGNEKMRSIVLPESLKTVGSSAFAYCQKLEAVVFKGNVTQIGNSAFRYCTSLEEITLPASVNIIAESAFSHCTSLKSIHFGGTKAQWDKIYFGQYWNVYMPEYTVYCTDGEIFVDLYSKYREVQ